MSGQRTRGPLFSGAASLGALCWALVLTGAPAAAAPAVVDGGFVQGQFYVTSYGSKISRFDAIGHPLPPFPLVLPDQSQPYGLTQGPDGLLYIVVGFLPGIAPGQKQRTPEVFATNSRGEVVRRYPCLQSCGPTVLFDAAGSFYLLASEGLLEFARGGSTPAKLVKLDADPRGAGYRGLVQGPGQHFLFANGKHLFDATGAGGRVREIKSATVFESIQDLAYDAAAGALYVVDQTGVFRLDAATGRLLQKSALYGGQKLLLTADGRLVVTCRHTPQMFTKDLRPLGAFDEDKDSKAGQYLAEIRIGLPGKKVQVPPPGPGGDSQVHLERTAGARPRIVIGGGSPAAAPASSGLAAAPASSALAEARFVRGDFFATGGTGDHTIAHYDPAGGALAPIVLDLPKSVELRGLTQGPDGLLYVVAEGGTVPFTVLAVNRRGEILKRYLSHDPGLRRPFFDAAGNLLVVANGALVRFKLGDESSATAFSTAVVQRHDAYQDLVILPNGNILGTLMRNLGESRPDGTFVREIKPSLRPNEGFSGISSTSGLAYDPATGSIYVWMSGYTRQFNQLYQLDFATGEIRRQATVEGGGDILVTQEGKLVVGGWRVAPQILSKDLRHLGAFAGPPRSSVTQIQLGRSRP